MEPTGAPPPQPPPPPTAPVKKKTSPLVWILVGCVGLVVVVGILFAAAGVFFFGKAKDAFEELAENPVRASVEAAVRLNPELELVSTDDQAETMTIRNTRTGEVATFDWSEIQNGTFRFESPDGEEYTVDTSEAAEGRIAVRDGDGEGVVAFGPGASEVPSWFPQYPGAVEVNVLVSATQDGQDSAIWTFQASAPPSEVLAFYEERLEGDGWEVTTSSASAGDTEQASVEATQDGGARSLNLAATATGGEPTQVMVTYTATAVP